MAIVKDFTISKGGGRDHDAGYKRKLKINLREKSFATIFGCRTMLPSSGFNVAISSKMAVEEKKLRSEKKSGLSSH